MPSVVEDRVTQKLQKYFLSFMYASTRLCDTSRVSNLYHPHSDYVSNSMLRFNIGTSRYKILSTLKYQIIL